MPFGCYCVLFGYGFSVVEIVVVGGIAAFIVLCVWRSLPRRKPDSATTPPSVQEASELQKERERILRERKTYNRLSIALGLTGLALLVAPTLGILGPQMMTVAWVISPVLFGVAGSFFALYRGQNPAWGLLSWVSLLLLNLLPDLRQRRLWEIENLSPSTAPVPQGSKYLPKFFWWSTLLAIFYPLSPIALFLSIKGLRDSQCKKKPLLAPICAVVWCACWACLLVCVVVVVLFFEDKGAAQSSVAISSDGKYQLTVPSGWGNVPDLIAQTPGATLALTLPDKNVLLMLLPDDKRDFASLDGYTDLRRKMMLQSGLANPTVTASTQLAIGGRSARRFEARGSRGSLNFVYVISVIETANDYCVLSAWTTPSEFDQHKAEILRVVDSFSACLLH